MTGNKGSSENSKSKKPDRETYKGRMIVVRSAAESRKLTDRAAAEGEIILVEIDDRQIEVVRTGPKEFHSILMPYKTYTSALDIAKDVIDYEPSFSRH